MKNQLNERKRSSCRLHRLRLKDKAAVDGSGGQLPGQSCRRMILERIEVVHAAVLPVPPVNAEVVVASVPVMVEARVALQAAGKTCWDGIFFCANDPPSRLGLLTQTDSVDGE